MTEIEKIKKRITNLSKNDFQSLSLWIAQKDSINWDNEIVENYLSGKLDFLVKESEAEKYNGTLENL